MAFFDMLNQVAKNIGDKTSEAIEITKLNSKINSERVAADEDLKKIGEFYYSVFIRDGVIAPEVLELCQSVSAHMTVSADAQAEIDRLHAQEAALAQEAAMNREAALNTSEVLQTESPSGIICSSCGASNAPGTKFCCECGSKLEIPVKPMPSICPSCGATVADGLKFCGECGTRITE